MHPLENTLLQLARKAEGLHAAKKRLEVLSKLGLPRLVDGRKGRNGQRQRESLATRLESFWRRTNVGTPDQCWTWLGSDAHGYGVFNFGRIHRAHKFSFWISYCDITACVLHKCDNPICVNPAHLFQGSFDDNIQDCIRKGRWRAPAGELNGHTKLTAQNIQKIRSEYKRHVPGHTFIALAEKYGVDYRAIWNIVNRKSWRHIQ